jgi:hypothetical protein
MEKFPAESKVCFECNQPINGQFVKAVKKFHHIECFRCHTCKEKVTEKFFPVTVDNNILFFCEKDFFSRMDLVCSRCKLALRGPYIKVNNQKYHLEHFSCSVCDVRFKQNDPYYEKDDQVYCRKDYSFLYAQKCGGCNTTILKNFVETQVGGLNFLIPRKNNSMASALLYAF